MIVTYLELRDPAGLRRPSQPAPAGMAVRRSFDPAVNRDLYERIGKAHEWVDRLPWSEAQWREWCEGCETHLIELGGEAAGFFELRSSGAAAQISIFGLLEAYRGRGIGGHALVAAAERGFALAPLVRVSTNTLDSEHALENYLARGFEVVARGPRAP